MILIRPNSRIGVESHVTGIVVPFDRPIYIEFARHQPEITIRNLPETSQKSTYLICPTSPKSRQYPLHGVWAQFLILILLFVTKVELTLARSYVASIRPPIDAYSGQIRPELHRLFMNKTCRVSKYPL